MKKQSYLITTSMVCALLFSCSTIDSLKPFDQQQAAVLLQQHGSTHPAKQMVSIALPQKQQWKKSSFTPDEISAFVMLVPQQESVSHFSESIQGRTLPLEFTPNVTAAKYVDAEIKHAKQTCQKTSVMILSTTPQEITYRLDATQCDDAKNQWQMGKVFNGADAVYSIRYVADADKISAAHFKQVSQAIQSAVLVRDPRASF